MFCTYPEGGVLVEGPSGTVQLPEGPSGTVPKDGVPVEGPSGTVPKDGVPVEGPSGTVPRTLPAPRRQNRVDGKSPRG